jgi:hypothetical protein
MSFPGDGHRPVGAENINDRARGTLLSNGNGKNYQVILKRLLKRRKQFLVNTFKVNDNFFK